MDSDCSAKKNFGTMKEQALFRWFCSDTKKDDFTIHSNRNIGLLQ